MHDSSRVRGDQPTHDAEGYRYGLPRCQWSSLETPAKNWKFSANDAKERGFWKDYMRAYEDAIRETAAEHAPWYVIPADNKWYTRVIVASAING